MSGMNTSSDDINDSFLWLEIEKGLNLFHSCKYDNCETANAEI